jgi:hypothetical protein
MQLAICVTSDEFVHTHELSSISHPEAAVRGAKQGTPGTVCITGPKCCAQIARERSTVGEKLRLIERDVVAAVACTVALIGIIRC